MELNINLKNKTHYSNSGNHLSKTLILKEILKKYSNILLVVDDDINLKMYLKIFTEYKINFTQIKTIAEIVDLTFNKKGFFIVKKEIFEAKLPNKYLLTKSFSLDIKVEDYINLEDVSKKLHELGYKFSKYDNPGCYQKIGDTITISPFNSNKTYKISLWGDIVENILEINNSINSQNNTKKLKNIILGKNEKIDFNQSLNKLNNEFVENINDANTFVVLDSAEFYNYYEEVLNLLKTYISFDNINNFREKKIDLEISDLFIENIEVLTKILADKKINKKTIITKNTNTIKKFLSYNNIENIEVLETKLNNLKSFKIKDQIIICDDNISKIFIKKRVKRSLAKNLDLLMQIKPGDYIVHIEHGIGIFKQIIKKELGKITKEYVEIEYKENDKLFVPIEEIHRVSKYIGSENPKLTGLGGKTWEKKLKKAGEDVEKIAKELLDIYAKRKLSKGFSFIDFEEKQNKFQRSFPYNYTEDQIKSINEIWGDMSSSKTMDRLLTGDVGFGKTEVAFNAIYKAFLNKKQSALISPLVVLTYEHYDKALERFRDFGMKIEVITRLEKSAKIKNTLEKLKSGQIDLIIGTHRLLSTDIEFKNLGLLVVDEEHKFGVKDKEKIKSLKGNIDILSMSATPIPRTLNMALNGIRDISMLTTPPIGRLSIETYVSKFDDKIIKQSMKREFARDGQVFFIHNRVQSIDSMAKYLKNLFPKKKIIITHGQLPGNQIEDRILAFRRKKYDILLSTTVIENGIDFPNVNTILINDSYNFGISQIHQLRGRVGRSDIQGFCYLLYRKDKIKNDAAKRLKTLVDYSHLGAGFELAIKDLEVRGGGDILGIKQSGESINIGVNLYIQMLEEKIEELKIKQGEKIQSIQKINTSIDLNIGAYIPEGYFNSELDKINFYREIESLNNLEDLNNIINDFKDLNPDFPQETKNLFDLLKLKIIGYNHKIFTIKKVGINYQIDFNQNASIEDLKSFLKLDTEVKFTVISAQRLRSKIKNFTSEQKFLEYILNLFEAKKKKLKIKYQK